MLFIGLAAAMLLPFVRRSVPGWIEAFIWLGLIASCWLTVTNVQGGSARLLTISLARAAVQIVNHSIETLTASLKGWLAANEYGIAEAVVLIAVLDLFLLAALESRRQAKKSSPRIRLGEWFEFRPAEAARASVTVPDPSAQRNLRTERVPAMARSGFGNWFARLTSWSSGGVAFGSKAGQPRAVAGGRPIEIRGLASAGSIGYGPIGQSPAARPSLKEEGAESESNRLAS